MVNYKLGLNYGNNSFREVDLSFALKKNKHVLKSIDAFTLNFSCEEELKQYLKAKEVIEKDVNQPLIIFYGSKNVRNIPLMYADSREIIKKVREFSDRMNDYFEYRKTIAISHISYDSIMDNYKDIVNWFPVFEIICKNSKFMQELIGYVKDIPVQGLNVEDMNRYLHAKKTSQIPRDVYIALFDYFKKLFYRYNASSKELEFNYKGFRDFCAFYINFKKEYLLKKDGVEVLKEIMQGSQPSKNVQSIEENTQEEEYIQLKMTLNSK